VGYFDWWIYYLLVYLRTCASVLLCYFVPSLFNILTPFIIRLICRLLPFVVGRIRRAAEEIEELITINFPDEHSYVYDM
jgi:hypothetical protein